MINIINNNNNHNPGQYNNKKTKQTGPQDHEISKLVIHESQQI